MSGPDQEAPATQYPWREVSMSWTITDWGDWTPEMISLYLREVERGGGRVVETTPSRDGTP